MPLKRWRMKRQAKRDARFAAILAEELKAQDKHEKALGYDYPRAFALRRLTELMARRLTAEKLPVPEDLTKRIDDAISTS